MGSRNRPLSLEGSISTEGIYAIWQKLISNGEVSLDFFRSEHSKRCVHTSHPEFYVIFSRLSAFQRSKRLTSSCECSYVHQAVAIKMSMLQSYLANVMNYGAISVFIKKRRMPFGLRLPLYLMYTLPPSLFSISSSFLRHKYN